MNQQLPKEAIAARANLLINQPFFASHLLTKTKLVYDATCKTATTTGKIHTVGDWFCQLSLPERVFVLCHEVSHDIFGHIGRKQMYIRRGFGPDMTVFDPKRWDRACDYYINSLLVESNIGKMPSNGLIDTAYNHTKTVDQIYELLESNPDEDGQTNFDEHGEPEPGEGEDDQVPGPSTEQEIAEQVKANLAEARAAAQAAGKGLPGALAQVVGETLEPQVTWQEELRDFITRCAGNDEVSWRRCNRRRLANPPFIPYPGRDGHSLNSLVIAIDASGSIGPRELGLFLAEVRAMHEAVNPRECWVLWWDTGVTAVEIFEADELEALTPYGGGGTDYFCVPEWLEANGLDPDVVICLTDLVVTWPYPAAIRWPHLTVGTYQYTPAPFGKTIYLET